MVQPKAMTPEQLQERREAAAAVFERLVNEYFPFAAAQLADSRNQIIDDAARRRGPLGAALISEMRNRASYGLESQSEASIRRLREDAMQVFRITQRLRQLHGEHGPQTEEERERFRMLLDTRNSLLKQMGFNTSVRTAGGETVPCTEARLFATGQGGAEIGRATPGVGGFRDNLTMFDAFMAPILITAADRGVIQLTPEERRTLQADLNSDPGGWGYANLGLFTRSHAALLRIRDQMAV